MRVAVFVVALVTVTSPVTAKKILPLWIGTGSYLEGSYSAEYFKIETFRYSINYEHDQNLHREVYTIEFPVDDQSLVLRVEDNMVGIGMKFPFGDFHTRFLLGQDIQRLDIWLPSYPLIRTRQTKIELDGWVKLEGGHQPCFWIGPTVEYKCQRFWFRGNLTSSEWVGGIDFPLSFNVW